LIKLLEINAEVFVKFLIFTFIKPKRKTMKTLKTSSIAIIIFLSLSSALFNSCDKSQVVPFDISILNFPVTVGPLTAANGNERFFTTVFTTETEQKLNDLGASFDDIESAKLKSMKLRITSPSTRSFNDIDFCDAYAFTSDIPEEKIAYSDSIIRDGRKEIELLTNYNDLSKFVKEDAFSVYVQGYHYDPFTDSTTFEVDLVITVKVKTKE
jgi:hypothetical protein